MARSTCKKCGAVILNDFSRFGTWYYLDNQWRAWKCYNGEEHEPSADDATAMPSALPYERMVSEGDAELYYKYGVHEVGPNFGPEYVATMSKEQGTNSEAALRVRIAELERQIAEKELDDRIDGLCTVLAEAIFTRDRMSLSGFLLVAEDGTLRLSLTKNFADDIREKNKFERLANDLEGIASSIRKRENMKLYKR